MSVKNARQLRLARLIGEHQIASQTQLVELLSADGVHATQATVSRDLEDMGAIKVRGPKGDSIYAIPEFEPDRKAPDDHLRRVMSEWVADVSFSLNLVVMRTPPGCAHVVASALDRNSFAGVLGTVAGDDTILVVASQSVGGKELARQLAILANLGDAE